MRIPDDSLRGRTVIAADGLAIGEVTALLVDSETWRIDALRVKLRKEAADQIGVNSGLFHAATVELPVRVVQSVGDAVVLSAAVSALRQVIQGLSGSAETKQN